MQNQLWAKDWGPWGSLQQKCAKHSEAQGFSVLSGAVGIVVRSLVYYAERSVVEANTFACYSLPSICPSNGIWHKVGAKGPREKELASLLHNAVTQG